MSNPIFDYDVADFIDFINEHNPNERLCHTSFENCGVGDFLTTMGVLDETGVCRWAASQWAEEVLQNEDEQLFNLLNEDFSDVPTYGDLQIWLRRRRDNA